MNNEFEEILVAGWAPEFLAGQVLMHIRTSEIEAAAQCAALLSEMCRGTLLPPNCEKPSHRQRVVGRSCAVVVRLKEVLTKEERSQIGCDLI